MASGTIRIVRDNPEQTNGGSNGTPKPKGIIITPDPTNSTTSNGGPTVRQPSSGPTTNRKQRQSDAKRTTLSVEDRDGVTSQEVGSKVQPNKTTPAPTSRDNTARVYNRKNRPRYMAETESKQTATFLLSATEMVGVTLAGPIGEMTEFERGMLTPPLTRILQRTPLGIIEKTTPLIDICFLVMGGAIYFNRISGGVKFPSRPKTQGVQEDTKAPQAAPVENTVKTTRAGDVDGIAVPVPAEITSYMNGSI